MGIEISNGCTLIALRAPYFPQLIENPAGVGGLGGRGGSFGFGELILDGFIRGPLGFLSGTAFRFQGMVFSFLGFTIISTPCQKCPAILSRNGIDHPCWHLIGVGAT